MNNIYPMLNCLTLISLLSFAFEAKAEQKITQGEFELHYNTFPATFLSKEIANTYQITRSKNRGIVSLSVLNTTHSPPKALKANISISAKNLLNQNKDIKLIEIIEKDEAVYYLGTFSINNQEDVNFDISVTHKGSEKAIKLKFSREFYTD